MYRLGLKNTFIWFDNDITPYSIWLVSATSSLAKIQDVQLHFLLVKIRLKFALMDSTPNSCLDLLLLVISYHNYSLSNVDYDCFSYDSS